MSLLNLVINHVSFFSRCIKPKKDEYLQQLTPYGGKLIEPNSHFHPDPDSNHKFRTVLEVFQKPGGF